MRSVHPASARFQSCGQPHSTKRGSTRRRILEQRIGSIDLALASLVHDDLEARFVLPCSGRTDPIRDTSKESGCPLAKSDSAVYQWRSLITRSRQTRWRKRWDSHFTSV